ELITPGAELPAGIVVCNDSPSHLRLFYVLRQLAADGLPPVHLLDLPRRDSAAARVFAARQLHELTRFCAGLTGRTPAEPDLVAAAAAERRVGDAFAALGERRRAVPPQVTGATALSAVITALSAPPDVAA